MRYGVTREGIQFEADAQASPRNLADYLTLGLLQEAQERLDSMDTAEVDEAENFAGCRFVRQY